VPALRDAPPPSRFRTEMRQLWVEIGGGSSGLYRRITNLSLNADGIESVAWPHCSLLQLIRHQHRQRRVLEDVAGRAPEYHLAQTALGVGAFDEEIAAERLRGREDRLSG
jgi:hypothetical protein